MTWGHCNRLKTAPRLKSFLPLVWEDGRGEGGFVAEKRIQFIALPPKPAPHGEGFHVRRVIAKCGAGFAVGLQREGTGL